MIFSYHQIKYGIPEFYKQGLAHQLWALAYYLPVVFTQFAAARTLVTSYLVAVAGLAIITLCDFESNKSSNTFYGRAKSTSHAHSIQSIQHQFDSSLLVSIPPPESYPVN